MQHSRNHQTLDALHLVVVNLVGFGKAWDDAIIEGPRRSGHGQGDQEFLEIEICQVASLPFSFENNFKLCYRFCQKKTYKKLYR